jgi:hypothetical protein
MFVPPMCGLECFQGSSYMKRRSARPFMVEVKQTRPARTSLTATEARSRPDKTLWPELAQAAMEPPASVPQAAPAQRPERKAPETPARRVLPSLVPMFEIPDEPVAEPADEAVPAPRVRRPRRTRAPASEQDIAPQVQAAPPRPAAEPPLPVAEAPPLAAASGQGPSPRSTAGRRTKDLRLGERWKRRLPPALR